MIDRGLFITRQALEKGLQFIRRMRRLAGWLSLEKPCEGRQGQRTRGRPTTYAETTANSDALEVGGASALVDDDEVMFLVDYKRFDGWSPITVLTALVWLQWRSSLSPRVPLVSGLPSLGPRVPS